MGRRISLVVAAALGALLAGPAIATPIVVDEFADPAGGQNATILNGVMGSTATSVITGIAATGGSRALGLEVQSVLPGGSSAKAEVNGFSSPGNYQLSNSVAVDAAGTITYDANGVGLNLDLAGNTLIRLEGVLNDLATAYAFKLETFGGGSASCAAGTPAGFSGDVSCDFAGLLGGLSANDIDRITVAIDAASRGGDVLIDRLTLVPEPTTGLLFGLGTAGLAWSGRTRRHG